MPKVFGRHPSLHTPREQAMQNPMGEVARALEYIARSVSQIRMPESRDVELSNKRPERYSTENDVGFRVAATLDGTTDKTPLHIMVHAPSVVPVKGANLEIPSNEMSQAIGDTPIQGITEYRTRGNRESGSIKPAYIISRKTNPNSRFSDEVSLIPKQFKLDETQYSRNSLITWSSQEELADIISDHLGFIKALLDNPISKDITFYELTKSRPSVQEAYRLLTQDRTRKIADFTPEFLQRVLTVTDNLNKDLKEKTEYMHKLVKDKLLDAGKKSIIQSVQKLPILCGLEEFTYPYCELMTSEESFELYYSSLYQRIVGLGKKLIMLDGSEVGDFDIENPHHFFALIRAVVHPTVTDHAIKYRYKHYVAGMYDILPKIPQPDQKKPFSFD